MKKTVAVLLAVFVLLLTSCSGKNDVLRFDRYSSYEVYYENTDARHPFDNRFESIEKYYTETVPHGVIMSVYVYDEIIEHPECATLESHTLTKAEIRDVYYLGIRVEQELRAGQTIWLNQGFYTDKAEKEMTISTNWVTLLVPGVEYLIYTAYYDWCSRGNYLGCDIFQVSSGGVIPLSITPDEYGKILENNGFVYVEHDDICEKAIEKYINGNK